MCGCSCFTWILHVYTHCTNSSLECTVLCTELYTLYKHSPEVYSSCVQCLQPWQQFWHNTFWTVRYSVTRLSKWPVIWRLTSWQSSCVVVGVACSTGSVFERGGKVPKEIRCRACDVRTFLSDWTVFHYADFLALQDASMVVRRCKLYVGKTLSWCMGFLLYCYSKINKFGIR